MLQQILTTASIPPLPQRNKLFIPHGDRSLCVHQWGEVNSPLFLYLHGAGMSGSEFSLVAHGLSAFFNVVALDYAGHGDSSPLPSIPRKHDVDAEIDTVFKFFNGRTAIIQGSSLGGIYAAHYATTRRENILAVILSDSLPEMEKGILRGSKIYLENLCSSPIESHMDLKKRFIHKIATNKDGRKCVYACLSDIFENKTESIPPKFDPLISERISDKYFLSSWGDFERLSQPTLLLLGEKSKHLKKSGINRFNKRVKAPFVSKIPHAGHNLVIDNPSATCEAIVSFLERAFGT